MEMSFSKGSLRARAQARPQASTLTQGTPRLLVRPNTRGNMPSSAMAMGRRV